MDHRYQYGQTEAVLGTRVPSPGLAKGGIDDMTVWEIGK